ncbi:hypothetical protein [Nitrososphaera sp.]|uniref:hypothetical protein n=1 Tax=Nitrososphaera sp. TaxID=1971748 RepID=UPI00307ED42C
MSSSSSSSSSSSMEIINTILSSVTTVDLMKLFQKNPNLIDTMDGVARRIGQTASQVENDIGKLIDLGILVKIPSGKETVLVLDRKRAKEIDLKIESMLGWQQQRDGGA